MEQKSENWSRVVNKFSHATMSAKYGHGTKHMLNTAAMQRPITSKGQGREMGKRSSYVNKIELGL